MLGVPTIPLISGGIGCAVGILGYMSYVLWLRPSRNRKGR